MSKSNHTLGIVWFRLDLRLADNPALVSAIAQSEQILPIFIWSDAEEQNWPYGAASKWWLHQSLTELSKALAAKGATLHIFSGDSLAILQKLIAETGATMVAWNRRYDPLGVAQGLRIKSALSKAGIKVETHNSSLLHEPPSLLTQEGNAYKVFTPFWRQLSTSLNSSLSLAPPLDAPKKIACGKLKSRSLKLKELELEPTIDWCAGMREFWEPGEAGAHKRLNQFLDDTIFDYAVNRDHPNVDGVSLLSPHLHFGEIGPRQVWQAADSMRPSGKQQLGVSTFLKELGWREFAHHVLFHFPHTADRPLREQFEKFPWQTDKENLHRWQKGMTGYPIVDAGMRQLWHLGWMHNRVRMIVASFLTKDLLITWHEGAKWFWDTLVDADLPANTLGWQWASGCGADAAPYFRVFNPELQGEKFDPEGRYVRKWIPELANLPNEYIHKPWSAPPLVLHSAKVELGTTYPTRVIDHALARKRALEALSTTSKKRGP